MLTILVTITLTSLVLAIMSAPLEYPNNPNGAMACALVAFVGMILCVGYLLAGNL